MEVLVTTAFASEHNESKTSIMFWNPQNGTKVMTLRGLTSPAQSHSLSFIKNEGILVAESGKPFIHYWQCGSPLQNSSRILCPGKPGPSTISPTGHYIVVAMNDQIVIWQVETGHVSNIINSAHFRPITVLKFTADGSYLLSASQDGIVHVWSFIQIVSKSSTTCTSVYSWSHHSLAVTDIHVSTTGSGKKSNAFTVSIDRTLRMYSLVDGQLLVTIAFPSPLTAIAVDSCDTCAYVGTSNGAIFQCKLIALPRNVMEHHIGSESTSSCSTLKKHNAAISCLSVSTDGQLLASSDDFGNIYIWETISGQSIKTIATAPVSSSATTLNNKITNMQFWLGSPEHWKPGQQKPTIVFPEVAKLIESQDQQERHELEDIVTVWNRNRVENVDSQAISEELDKKALQIADLKQQLAKSEAVNKKLHEFCLTEILRNDH